jgi:hypothetical protein
MKNHFVALLSIALSISCAFAQDSVSKPEFKAGPFTCKQLSSNSQTLYCSYQNAEYSHIVDIASILFSNKTEVEEFCTDIQEAYSYIKAGNKDEGTWLPKGVDVRIMAPWVNGICVWGDDGYTIISPREKRVAAVIDGINAAATSIWE